MPYVARDDQGQIVDVQEHETASASEQIALDDPELASYLTEDRDEDGAHENIRAALEASDFEFIRVIEDVITVLIDKRVFMLTDLPAAAQQKLAQRYHLRSKLSDLGSIISDHEDIMLP
ncbi:MAG TPA: hypothetical protein VIR45_06015 [Kiloniellaceae bacterium]